jgi:hypothetical protein
MGPGPCIDAHGVHRVGGKLGVIVAPTLVAVAVLQGGPLTYAGGMNTIHLTDEELKIARHGMTAYLRSFGHDEAETVVLIRAVLARLAAAQPEPDPPDAQPEPDPPEAQPEHGDAV